MKYARKKAKIVQAYQLGADTPVERELIQEGSIRLLPDGVYELFSQEAVHGSGELARRGDYFKVDTVDGKRYPYPNDQAYFEAHHRQVQGDEYEQLSHVAAIWRAGDEACEELDYLLSTGKLVIRPEDSAHYFNAVLWGAELSAARDATLVFYAVDRDESMNIVNIGFNFVARWNFEQDYELLERDKKKDGPIVL